MKNNVHDGQQAARNGTFDSFKYFLCFVQIVSLLRSNSFFASFK